MFEAEITYQQIVREMQEVVARFNELATICQQRKIVLFSQVVNEAVMTPGGIGKAILNVSLLKPL